MEGVIVEKKGEVGTERSKEILRTRVTTYKLTSRGFGDITGHVAVGT